MVLAYHFILSAYGFWLPNDPRGSWSDYVGAFDLLRTGGRATKVETTRSVAGVPHDRASRLATKAQLVRPPVHFDGRQALSIAKGFAAACGTGGYLAHACCVLPAHCHLIIARHTRPVGQIVAHLKGAATQNLKADGMWTSEASPWGRKYWAPFIDSVDWLRSAIRYVEDNPHKEGKSRQRWSFVQPFTP